jgi:hypothetical protein
MFVDAVVQQPRKGRFIVPEESAHRICGGGAVDVSRRRGGLR